MFWFPIVAQGFSLLFGGGAEVEEHGEDEIQYFNFSSENSSYHKMDKAFFHVASKYTKKNTSLPNIALLDSYGH